MRGLLLCHLLGWEGAGSQESSFFESFIGDSRICQKAHLETLITECLLQLEGDCVGVLQLSSSLSKLLRYDY